ncbi:hypothetical protein DPMN_155530 [Dreissena polymorpha]|uniref:Uncharacterized protein n=1 Tax=Dreissena polymorpha TaxID=45954 RepID=A0A9D4FRD4_DREPO|nr:hypothetical protein DPMN_155530 [Dreissena polymorpha]
MVSEGALSRHRLAVYVDMDARIAEYWDQYDNRDISCEEFLMRVGEIYSQKV